MTTPMVAHELTCPECGAEMVLKQSRYGPFYGCIRWATTGCKGAHGAHPDGRPMGTPATLETRRARIEAHEAFDRLWKSGRMKRKQAYAWLSAAMGMPSEQAHISRFDVAQCRRVVEAVERELGVRRS